MDLDDMFCVEQTFKASTSSNQLIKKHLSGAALAALPAAHANGIITVGAGWTVIDQNPMAAGEFFTCWTASAWRAAGWADSPATTSLRRRGQGGW